MKITEVIIAPKESKDTTSCGTTSSGQPEASAQDIVPHNIVPENNLEDLIYKPNNASRLSIIIFHDSTDFRHLPQGRHLKHTDLYQKRNKPQH